MIGTQARRRFVTDNRGVSVVVGAILIFGFLILTLAVYQVQIVPEQNAQAEFEHFEDSQNELIELREAILTAGENDVTQFPSLTLGTTYQPRLLTVNPPPPTGTLQTSDPYNITIENDDGEHANVTTRFLEYQPGYNEHSIGTTRFEHSVLYLDERDRGNNVSIIEDQHIVDDGTVTVTAVQNEFQQTGTGRVTLELYPLVDESDIELPDSNDEDYTVLVPTLLTEDEYWDEALEDSGEVYEGVEERDNEPNALTLEVAEDDFELNTVGIRSAPDEGPASSTDTEPVDGETITANRIDDLVENQADQDQEFEFTLNEEELAQGRNVSIDISEPNAAGVDYESATAAAEGNDVTIVNDGDTIEFEASENIDVDDPVVVTVDELDVEDDTAGEFDDITFTRDDTQDSSTESFEVQSTITADSIDDLVEDREDQEQRFDFTLREELDGGDTVRIDVSEANDAGVGYDAEDIALEASGNNNPDVENDGETLVFEAQGNADGEQFITVSDLDVTDGAAGDFENITFTRDDNDDVSTESFKILDSDVTLGPSIREFETDTRQGQGQGQIGITGDWRVEAGDADLSEIEVEAIDRDDGSVVESETWDVAGQRDADGDFTFDDGDFNDGEEYDVTITVTDQDDQSESETVRQEAG